MYSAKSNRERLHLKCGNEIAVRVKIIVFFLVCTFIALATRLYYVQIHRHSELFVKAKDKYTAVTSRNGKRGEIYDFNGNLMVGNSPCADIIADPQIVGDDHECKRLAAYFSKKLKISYKLVYRRLSTKFRLVKRKNGEEAKVLIKYAVIAKKVDFALAERIKLELRDQKSSGVYFQESNRRYYPKKQLLANILGFTNIVRDKAVAVLGVEKLFNQKISPTSTKSKFERSRDGMPLSYGDQKINREKDGLNVYLTIREPIQAILEEEMDQLVEKWKPRAAYAIMADPYTGDILALAQRPTYNPNDRQTMRPDAWRNRITEDIFEPGSTMKPIAVAGALDYGVVSPGTKFDCEGGYWMYAGKPLRDAHRFDILTVSEIIKFSSNIGTAKIALQLGDRRLYQVLRRFGFGKRTGIQLKPETKGIFRSLKNWDKLSITRFPIGQGIAVSPLQLVRSYCALANGGDLVKLRLVDRLENPDTGVCVKMPMEPAPKVYSRPDTHRKILEMMKLVTREGGTAEKARVDGYDVAGKTGTSQKWIDGVGYSHSKYFASFIGFVPADKPAFVLLVTADEPKKSYYGGTVSAPTFKSVSHRVLRYLNVRPEYKLIEEDDNIKSLARNH